MVTPAVTQNTQIVATLPSLAIFINNTTFTELCKTSSY